MAQVTEALVDEQFARNARGERMNLTLSEEATLLLAWREQTRYQMISAMRMWSENDSACKPIALNYGFATEGTGTVRSWFWHQEKAELQPFNIIKQIYEEMRVVFVKTINQLEGNQNAAGSRSSS